MEILSIFSGLQYILLHGAHGHAHESVMLPILTGTIAAVLHVVSGPDHLAAVTPLAIEARKKVWAIGLYWGGGHLAGMLIIGLLFLGFQELLPLEAISAYSEQLVGVVLIGVGGWAIASLYLNHRKKAKHHKHAHIHLGQEPYIHVHSHDHSSHGESHTHPTAHAHVHTDSETAKKKSNEVASFGIGTLHGLAGIAHFILFIPVLGFNDQLEGLQYIIGFALGTVLAMTLYTYLLGRIAGLTRQRNNPNFFQAIRITGGLFAVLIGIYWLYLTI